MPRQLKLSVYDALLRCASPHTEAPDKFIIWSAFSIIGGVLKNHVFIKDGLYTLHPNQYIVLVSPPGIGKGTAMNFSWGIIREKPVNPLVNIVQDRITAPRILEKIAVGWNSSVPQIVNQQLIIGGAVDHTCTIFSTELQVLTTASDWMLTFLTDTWDRYDYEYETKNKGSSNVKSMCTSLIGGTVPDFIQNIDRNTSLPIKGGFSSRCLFIYADTPARELIFPPPIDSNPQSMALLAAIKNDLEHIAYNIAGEYTYNTEARIKFENFIKANRPDDSSDNLSVRYFKTRVRAHVLKLAMIISASRNDSLIIDGYDMDNSISYIKTVLCDLEKVFRGAGESELAPAIGKVRSFIEKMGMANQKELMRQLHTNITFENLQRVLYTLETAGYVVPITRGKVTYWVDANKNGRGKP